MPQFRVVADMRFWPTSGLGKVESAIVSRKPQHATLEKLSVKGKYGHPLSTYRLAKALSAERSENAVFWSAGFVPPLYSQLPTVVTVHDLTHLHYYDKKKKYYFNTIFRPLFKKCSAVICVSEHTRRELVDWSGIDPSNVHVVHNGMDPRYAENREKKELGFRYILYAGNHRSYKNIHTLIKAYDLADLASHGIHLAITGGEDPDLGELVEQTGRKGFVHFLGNVPEAEMPALYRGAEVASYISLYEGFGLPILEAMASEVPVVTSNVSSMPEVAGDAALLVDPLSVADVAEALRNAALKPDLRASMIAKGLDRIQQFSWDRSASQVWTLLERLALRS